MNIPTSEYEKQRHVFDLCQWVNEKLSLMQGLPDFETIYFERKGINVKKFLEEVIPIACLGLYFFRPADSVLIQCFAGSQGYDAKLEVSGHRNFRIDIEVTTTETDESVLNRQSLSWNGYAYPGSPVRREGGSIVFEPEMSNASEHYNHWVNLAFERYLSKAKKAYGKKTAILVMLDTYLPLPLRHRAELVARTRSHLEKNQQQIYGAYYGYRNEFVVDAVEVKRDRSRP